VEAKDARIVPNGNPQAIRAAAVWLARIWGANIPMAAEAVAGCNPAYNPDALLLIGGDTDELRSSSCFIAESARTAANPAMTIIIEKYCNIDL
jgi:hypothetical protein